MENHLYGDNHTKIFLEKFQVKQFENELLREELLQKETEIQALKGEVEAKDEQLRQSTLNLKEAIEMLEAERKKERDRLNSDSSNPG